MNIAQSADSLLEDTVGALDQLGLFSTIDDEKENAWFSRLGELHALYELEDNWDGEGAEPLSRGNIDSAIQYFKTLYSQKQTPPPSRVTASQDGEVIIEWQINGVYIEATISQPYLAECMYVYPDGSVRHFDVEWAPPKSNYLWEDHYNYAA